jgi:hypothetical protein
MNTFFERIRFERYRVLVISAWPEGGAKQAALASARAALERELAFVQTHPAGMTEATHVGV